MLLGDSRPWWRVNSYSRVSRVEQYATAFRAVEDPITENQMEMPRFRASPTRTSIAAEGGFT